MRAGGRGSSAPAIWVPSSAARSVFRAARRHPAAPGHGVPTAPERRGRTSSGLSQRGRRVRAAPPRRKPGQVEQPGQDAHRRVTGDDRAARRRSPACRSAARSRTCCAARASTTRPARPPASCRTRPTPATPSTPDAVEVRHRPRQHHRQDRQHRQDALTTASQARVAQAGQVPGRRCPVQPEITVHMRCVFMITVSSGFRPALMRYSAMMAYGWDQGAAVALAREATLVRNA